MATVQDEKLAALRRQFVVMIENGGFVDAAGWTLGTGWTIAGGVASSDGSQVGDSDLTRTPASPALTSGESYTVVFTITAFTAGNVRAVVGDTGLGANRAAVGVFTEVIVAGAGADVDLRADLDFIGSIDDVVVNQLSRIDTGDLERRHVDALIVGTPAGTLQDRWMQFWDEEIIAIGSFNDRAHVFLDGLGHTSDSLTEQWKQYWIAQP